MPQIALKYSGYLAPSDPLNHPVLIIGQPRLLAKLPFEKVKVKLEPRVTEEIFKYAVDHLQPSPTDTCHLYLNAAVVAALPPKCSRHNTPSRSHSITKLVKNCTAGVEESIVIVTERKEIFASACAVARAFPLYSQKGKCAGKEYTVRVEFVIASSPPDGYSPLTDTDLLCLSTSGEAIQMTSRIVDTPCNEMHTDAFLEEIRTVGESLGIKPHIICGDELDKLGFGGIYSVGKAAVHPPALAVLSHTPPDAKETIAWVGKGIVYDTGGLCIKSKNIMGGMKRDCGGAAAILGAFYAAVKLGFRENLHAVFCLAENSVGPNATRPDDIIRLYSGRSVEINNTDAEGRLVLGDGVAYAQKDLKASIVLDMATLTGAQGTATGKYHAAVITNKEEWEIAAVRAGRTSGDLVHPLPFCPELHFSEFASALADMRNSVADRSNAQSSCAGLFIGSHMGFDFPGTWIHVDMAYPVHCGDRATGYGVALLLTLFGYASDNPMLQSIAPFTQINGGSGGGGGGEEESSNKKIRLV